MPQWSPLGSSDSKALTNARLECHHAVQLATRLARGFLPAQPDDSHTTLAWDFDRNALKGRAIETDRGTFSLGLRIADLTLLLMEGPSTQREYPLHGVTLAFAMDWLSTVLTSRGLDPKPLYEPLHFALDDHPLLHGASFSAEDSDGLAELSRYYANAALLLDEVAHNRAGASPVRCWPHHFDIATLIADGSCTLGAGLSPGDGSYAQPYFYVSPWPYPDPASLPPLQDGAFWHTEGWVGAVVLGEQIVRREDQESWCREFITKSCPG